MGKFGIAWDWLDKQANYSLARHKISGVSAVSMGWPTFEAGRMKAAPQSNESLFVLVDNVVSLCRGKCQTACKPGSVCALPRMTTIPLGRALPHASRDQPGQRGGNAPGAAVTPGRPPLFGLAPGGVYPAAPVARGAVRSCRTVSPLPSRLVSPAVGRFVFCGTFPGVAPAGR